MEDQDKSAEKKGMVKSAISKVQDKYGWGLLLNALIPLIAAIIYWVFQYKDKEFTMSDFFTLLFVSLILLLASYYAVTRTADSVAKACVHEK